MADELPRRSGPAAPSSSWPNTPVAVVRNITLYTDVLTIIKLTQTCTKFANALSEAFWRDIFVTKWGHRYRTDLMRPLELPSSTPSKMAWYVRPNHPSKDMALFFGFEIRRLYMSSWEGRPSASSPFDLRQCCVCNQLELLTYGQMERERHPDTLRHSDSRWISPCSCGTFCHRQCFEDLWAAKTGLPLSCSVTATTVDGKVSTSMSRRVRCTRCNSPYALRKRKTHHHFELASIALKKFRQHGLPRLLAKHALRFLAVFVVFSAYQNLQFEGKTMVCYHDSDSVVGSVKGTPTCGDSSSSTTGIDDLAADATVTYETSASIAAGVPYATVAVLLPDLRTTALYLLVFALPDRRHEDVPRAFVQMSNTIVRRVEGTYLASSVLSE
eukprot:jgi/Bigna1/89261/estExt_fgenesh1_pg.C_460058